jgi:hypothetical protein
MKLFAYYQQDYNGFVLFFNNNGVAHRANVENIHGLKDLLTNGDSVRRIHADNKEYAQSLLDKQVKGPELITISLADLMPDKDIEDLVML